MRLSVPFIAIAALLAPSVPANADERSDAETSAWSAAFAAWVDVSRNIACPALKPRIDALTKLMGDVQDAFVERHPDYVFPPMVYASRPFIDCDAGTPLVARAEALAGQAERLIGR